MEALPLLIPLVIMGVAVAVRYAMQSGTTPPWQLAAQRLGLDFTPASLLDSPKIHGRMGDFDVQVDIVTRGSGNSRHSYTRLVIDTYGRVPDDVALASETFWSSLDLMGEEIDIGDASFDDYVKTRGVESTLLAVLDEPTRALVTQYVRSDKGLVKDGRLMSETMGRERSAERLVEKVLRMAEVGRRLSIRTDQVPDRIADNVASEPHPGVRLHGLKYLCTYYRRSDACTRAATTALDDDEPSVRLLAAKTLGTGGIATLERLVMDTSAGETIRTEALELLADRLPKDDLTKLVADLLERPNALAATALRVVEKERLRGLVRVVERLVHDDAPPVARNAARALGAVGEVGDVATTQALVALLDHQLDDVKAAACAALGRIGTLDAVEPLLDHTRGIFKDGDLKRAARKAVEAIQGRAGNADGGRLSVVDGGKGDGALSVSADAGAVGIVPED